MVQQKGRVGEFHTYLGRFRRYEERAETFEVNERGRSRMLLQFIMNECVGCRWRTKVGGGKEKRGDEMREPFFFVFFIRSIF